MQRLKILETLRNHPQHEVGIGARAQGAVRPQDGKLVGELLESVDQLGSGRETVIGAEGLTPARADLVEEIADVLASCRRGCFSWLLHGARHKSSHGLAKTPRSAYGKPPF